MAERLINILKDLSGILNVKILNPEYEIILPLIDRSGLSTEQIQEYFSSSRGSFFNTMSRLRGSGILQCELDRSDKRKKIFVLSQQAAHEIVRNIIRYSLSEDELDDFFALPKFENDINLRMRQIVRVGDPSLECRILFYLFKLPGSNNSALHRALRGSATKLNACLGRLTDSGVIRFERDEQDLRLKRYDLGHDAREVIEETNARVQAWIMANRSRFAGVVRAPVAPADPG